MPVTTNPSRSGPTPKERGNFWIGISICFFVLGLLSHLHPPSAPAKGYFSLVHRLFFNEFGPVGEVLLYSLVGMATLLVGLSYRSDKSGSGAKTPDAK